MIKLQNLTPEIYYTDSRDFQFIGRLYDLLLNSVKTNTELLYNIPLNDNVDSRLLDLLSMSIGFKAKHNYSTLQLEAICKIFATILRNKGSLQALEDAGNALLCAEGINQRVQCKGTGSDITLIVPQNLTDINLLKDLLAYVLPAGVSCKIAREFMFVKEVTTSIKSDNMLSHNADINMYSNDTGIIAANEASSNKASVVSELTGAQGYYGYGTNKELFINSNIAGLADSGITMDNIADEEPDTTD